MISINSIKVQQTQYINVDFGWYYQEGADVVRATPYTYTDGSSNYPPGATTLISVSGSSPAFTLMANNITLYDNTENESVTDFDTGSGDIFILQDDNWAIAQYGSVTPGASGTFNDCEAYAGSQKNLAAYTEGAVIYDPRFYIPGIPLTSLITFDALDSQNLGLPTTDSLGIYPVRWIWDLGTGENQYGPQAQVSYNFSAPPRTLQVSLTVVDNLGNEHVGHHHIIFNNSGLAPSLISWATN
jgi:hypothetical protein